MTEIANAAKAGRREWIGLAVFSAGLRQTDRRAGCVVRAHRNEHRPGTGTGGRGSQARDIHQVVNQGTGLSKDFVRKRGAADLSVRTALAKWTDNQSDAGCLVSPNDMPNPQTASDRPRSPVWDFLA